MWRATTQIFLVGVSVTLCPACTAREHLPVKLFNDAYLENNALEAAREEAAWLLKSVCIDVAWIFCPVITAANFAPCSGPADAAELHMLPYPLTSEVGENVMGLAMPNVDGRGRGGPAGGPRA